MSPADADAGGASQIRVLDRALAVLGRTGEAVHGVTLYQLHQDLGIPLGSLHRILSTLEARGFVTRSAQTKRYSPGPAALRLAQRQEHAVRLVEPPQPLAALATTTHETVFLTQLIDSRVICVSLVEAVHPLRLFVRIGQEMPLHAAASARTILAFRDSAFVEMLLATSPGHHYTDDTLSGVNAVMDHLSRVRAWGFDVCADELDSNVWAVGAPVRDDLDRVEFAVTLAAASGRMPSARSRAEAAHAVMQAAKAMSERLGCSDPPAVPSVKELQEHPAIITPSA